MENRTVTVKDTSYSTNNYGTKGKRNAKAKFLNVEYKGRALEVALTRARRYLRSGKSIETAPRHVALALDALLQLHPSEFIGRTN